MPHKIWLILLSALIVACSAVSAPEPTATLVVPDVPTVAPEPTATPAFVFSSDAFSQGMLAKRNGDYARAAAAFQAVLTRNPPPDQAQEAQFRLGEAYWLNHDDARALNAFLGYLQGNPTGGHADQVHYFLADSYRRLKDYPNALLHLKTYRDGSQTLGSDTDAGIADLLVLAGDPEGAIQQYDRALTDNTLAASARVNILLRAADVLLGKGQPALAAARYDAALAVATDARTRADLDLRAGEALAAAGQLEQAKAHWSDAVLKYPEQPATHKALVNLLNRNVAVDDFQRGLIDYNAGSYDAAISALQNHLQAKSPRAGDAHYYLALAYARKGNLSQAMAEYDKIIKGLPKDKRVADAYLGKAGVYGTQGKVDDAVALYKKFTATFPQDAQADDALWRAAALLDQVKRYGDAADVFEDVQAKYPGRDRAAEALFRAGLDYYRNKDWKTAGARWQAVSKDYSQSTYSPRALFWQGKAAQARGQADAAKTAWTQLSGLRSGYYSWRAADLLQAPPSNNTYDPARYSMDNPADRTELDKWLQGWNKDSGLPGNLDSATRGDIHFRRGAELLRLDRTVEARREFATVIANRQDDVRALYALAFYFKDNNLFSQSIDCAERIAKLAAAAGAPQAPRLLWMLRYPTYYDDLVLAESKANQVDPLLYWALIRQESGFNAWSTSSADARGLGQIMPSTAKDIAQRLGVKNYALEQLFLPFVNIRFGVWYFAQDLKTFSEPIYALAAYNAGAGRTKQWQRPDLDQAVEEIDVTQTGSYVRIVYSNWRQYQSTYGK